MTENIELYFDGACRGNGKKTATTGCGYVINNEHEGNKYIGHGTNNTAEYSGLINGLEKVKELYGTDVSVKVHGDSKLVIEQMKGKWKIKASGLIPYNQKAKELAREFKSVQYIHVKRELNSKADEQANKSFDN